MILLEKKGKNTLILLIFVVEIKALSILTLLWNTKSLTLIRLAFWSLLFSGGVQLYPTLIFQKGQI